MAEVSLFGRYRAWHVETLRQAAPLLPPYPPTSVPLHEVALQLQSLLRSLLQL